MGDSRNFKDDFDKSNDLELRKSWMKIFVLKFGKDIEVSWKDDKDIQKGLGTDITIKTSKGRRYSVELKTRNHNCIGTPYIMEIVNHWYDRPEKELRKHLKSYPGWIYTTTAEYIFHATLDKNGKEIIECIYYSLIPFKTTKWKSEFEKYESLWLKTGERPFHLTLNKLIPKSIINHESLEFWEWKQ